MKTAKPIKDHTKVRQFKQYYLKKGAYRNYLLVSICLNSALRISDVLKIKAEDLFDFDKNEIRSHLVLTEQKTGKRTEIFLNKNMRKAIILYQKNCRLTKGYIFKNTEGKPITRIQAHRIIKSGAEYAGIDISCHSLRKTFGYHAWKNGVPAVLLMKIFNHSSFEVTKRYLGIEQEDKDRVFERIRL